MRIRIQGNGDKRALTDLQAWLGRDPKARRIPVAPVSEPGPTMGALDAIDLILGSAIDIANFAVAYVTWRMARASGRPQGARTLTHGGTTVDIGHLSADELVQLLRRLEDTASDADPSPADPAGAPAVDVPDTADSDVPDAEPTRP
ncbi:effector-associated constant component EACC1 [Streptomyces sp. INA 01156]